MTDEPPTVTPDDIKAVRVQELPPPADWRMYTVAEVAKALGVEVTTVYDWITRGRGGKRLPTLSIPRGRILPRDLMAWLAELNDVVVAIKEPERPAEPGQEGEQ